VGEKGLHRGSIMSDGDDAQVAPTAGIRLARGPTQSGQGAPDPCASLDKSPSEGAASRHCRTVPPSWGVSDARGFWPWTIVRCAR
jgi:hypothetical protein